MIVTCGECSTSFQLDEARIPAGGARLRCSRCKHAFFLPHPSGSGCDAVHAIAEEAAQQEQASGHVPTASEDLAGLDGSIASEANPTEPEPESEEQDWQFTEEIRVEGDDDLDTDGFDLETDFGEAFDDSTLSSESRGHAGSSGSDLDFEIAGISSSEGGDLAHDHDADPGTPPDSDLGDGGLAVEAGHDVSSFGSVEDFSALTEDIDAGLVDSGSSEVQDLSDDSEAGLYSASGSTDDLGDPESWDLSPGADYEASKASIAGLVGSFSSGGVEAAGLSGGGTLDADLDPAHFEADLEGSSTLFDHLSSLGSLAGWMITVAAVASVGYLSLESEWARWESPPQRFSQGSFVAETTSARWVDTTRLGPLLVVDGVARNTGVDLLKPPRLQVELLNGAGHRLPEGGRAVGEPMSERILREGTLAEIRQARFEAPRRFQATALHPGESRAFQVVLGELPPTARRILLDVHKDAARRSGKSEPRGAIEMETVAAGVASDESAAEKTAEGEVDLLDATPAVRADDSGRASTHDQ